MRIRRSAEYYRHHWVDYYGVLSLPRTASQAEIALRFQHLATLQMRGGHAGRAHVAADAHSRVSAAVATFLRGTGRELPARVPGAALEVVHTPRLELVEEAFLTLTYDRSTYNSVWNQMRAEAHSARRALALAS